MRDFASRLMAYETTGNQSSPAAFRVCEKLRPQLANLMGNAGFHALLARALALANPHVPWLHAVRLKADGSLQGLDEPQPPVEPEKMDEGGVVLVSQLLSLLVAFIGEDLTLRMVREVWHKVPPNDLNLAKGGKNEKEN